MTRFAQRRRLDIFTTVFCVALVDALALSLIVPILPAYTVRLGGDALEVGLVAASYPLTQLVGAPLFGALSDRIGRRRALILCLLGSALGYGLLASAWSVETLVLARLVDGLSGGNVAVAYAVLSDTAAPQERTRVFGMVIGSAFGLAFIFGPLIAVLVLALSERNYALVAWVATLYSLLAAAVTLKLLPETRRATPSPVAEQRWSRTPVPHPSAAAVVLLGVLALQQLAFGGFERLFGFFNLVHLGIGAEGTGYLFAYIGVLTVWAQTQLLPRWRQRFGDLSLLLVALVCLAIGLLALSLTPPVPAPWYDPAALRAELQAGGAPLGGIPSLSVATSALKLPETPGGWQGLVWVLLCLIPVSLGGALLRPVLNSLISRRVPEAQLGTVMGVAAAVVSVTSAAGALLGSLAFGTSAGAPFTLGALAAGAALVVAIGFGTCSAELGFPCPLRRFRHR